MEKENNNNQKPWINPTREQEQQWQREKYAGLIQHICNRPAWGREYLRGAAKRQGKTYDKKLKQDANTERLRRRQEHEQRQAADRSCREPEQNRKGQPSRHHPGGGSGRPNEQIVLQGKKGQETQNTKASIQGEKCKMPGEVKAALLDFRNQRNGA